MFAFFLSSGLFLGWSLGANDAANVFGTAVGSKMVKFTTAAICCSVFVIIGSVVSGAGASHTLGKLGSVNAIAGAFIVAFAAASSVYLMTKSGYPVSTSQAIVGAIIGWNFFSGSLTDYNSLIKIVLTWIACPILSALIAMFFYKFIVFFIHRTKIHMFKLDHLTRYGLLLAGIFGSYSLGANNIANVMGVFVPVSPFSDISFYGLFHLSSAQQLFFIGSVAISVGVITYSKKVMMTVGTGIFELSPVAALVVVWAHSIVLFLFASQGLESFLIEHGLPSIPLVPVSSSQAIVGAIIGVGLLKGGRGIRWRNVGGISSGWLVTPIIAALISFICLFFLQNVFQQETFRPTSYKLTPEAYQKIQNSDTPSIKIAGLMGKKFQNAAQFKKSISKDINLNGEPLNRIIAFCEIDNIKVDRAGIEQIDTTWFTGNQRRALHKLEGINFYHKWMLNEALSELSPDWRFKSNNKKYNAELKNKLNYIHNLFRDKSNH